MMPRSSNSYANFLWAPLTRDGGAKLGREVQLYYMTRARDNETLRITPAPLPNDVVPVPDRREKWTPPAPVSQAYTRVTPKVDGERWAIDDGEKRRLTEALYAQGFRNIEVNYDGSHRMKVSVTNRDIHPLSRAAGRVAANTAKARSSQSRPLRAWMRPAKPTTNASASMPNAARASVGTAPRLNCRRSMQIGRAHV